MRILGQQTGNASLASVFGIMAIVGLYVMYDQRKTQSLRAEVQGETLNALGKQANDAALARTKNLLQKSSSQTPAIKIQNNSFQSVSGTGYEAKQGVLHLDSPDPRGKQWTSGSGSGSTLKTQVAVEKVETDSSGNPVAIIVAATTKVSAEDGSKVQKTRARFDLIALNSPTPPAGPSTGATQPNPGTTAPSTPGTAVASNNPSAGSPNPAAAGGPCTPGPLSPGNSAANSQTGNNTATANAQGQNTGASAQTTANSASSCSQSQTGGNTATATATGTGDKVTTKTSTVTTPNSSTATSSTVATGTGSVSANSSAQTSAKGGSGK